MSLIKDNSIVISENQDKIDLVSRVAKKDPQAQKEFYYQYEKMIKKIVGNFYMKNNQLQVNDTVISPSDYEQEVWCFLYENIYKYNPEKAMVSTYIYLLANACLNRYRENNSRVMRLPVYKTQLFNRMKKFCNEYEIENGEFPSEKILMDKFNINHKTMIHFYDYITHFISFDQSVKEDDESMKLSNTVKSNKDTEQEAMSNILYEEICEKIQDTTDLTPEQKEVANLWLLQEISDMEICDKLNVSKEELSLTKSKIKKNLKKVLISYR